MTNPNQPAPQRKTYTAEELSIFDRAWVHWYKFSSRLRNLRLKPEMDFIVSFARKEVLRDRKRRKP